MYARRVLSPLSPSSTLPYLSTKSQEVAQVGPRLPILLAQSPKCRDDRHVPLSLTKGPFAHVWQLRVLGTQVDKSAACETGYQRDPDTVSWPAGQEQASVFPLPAATPAQVEKTQLECGRVSACYCQVTCTLAKSTRLRSLSIWLICDVFCSTARAACARWLRDV